MSYDVDLKLDEQDVTLSFTMPGQTRLLVRLSKRQRIAARNGGVHARRLGPHDGSRARESQTMSWDDAPPAFMANLREMAAADLGVTLGREQLQELLAYLDAMLEDADLWNSAVEASERDE